LATVSPDNAVARYYDSNTRRFLTVGGGGGTLSIHRHLWGPGVRTTAEASGYVNHLLAEVIRERRDAHDLTILDMGCGVGGTLFHLAEACPGSRLHGITISETQCRLGNRGARERGVDARCVIQHGDFESTGLGITADVIVAVESFVHGSSRERVMQWIAAHLSDGGLLLLVDDFIASPSLAATHGGRRHIEDFQTGWRAPGICTVEDVTRSASRAGLRLEADRNLTPMIRLGRPRDRVIAMTSPLFRLVGLSHVPFFGNMIGGNALQAGLRSGLFEYRFLVLERRPA